MDSYNHIWRAISRYLKVAKNSAKEDNYQSAIYDIFLDSDFLGWPEDRVIREYPVQMGTTKRSDMVLLDSDKNPIITIEVKRLESAQYGVQQLGSYMNGCKPRVKFGITFKGAISVFYDEDFGHSLNSVDDAVLSAKIGDPNDSCGVKLVELLYFPTFSLDRLESFCKTSLESKEEDELRKRSILKVREWIHSADEQKLFVEALTEYIHSHTPKELANLDINTSIIREAISRCENSFVKNDFPSIKKDDSLNKVVKSSRHKYLFNGKELIGQATLAKEIFVKYAQETSCSCDELLETIRKYNIGKSAVKTEKEIKESRGNKEVKRETYPERNSFMTKDGIKMIVWTDFNNKEGHDTLKPIIDFARDQGWNVEILS